MAVLVLLLVLMMIDPGISQLNRDENNINIPIKLSCGLITPLSLSNFINNRNSTFTDLRSQLSRNGVYYARAQSLSDGDSVFGAAQCRNYLSAAQCVACFDVGVSELVGCTTGNSAYVFLDNCFVRYDNYGSFYNDPNAMEDTSFHICGNQSSQPITTFTEVVDGLLSDIRVATPKTSNFYVASTRQLSSNNATVYAIAQCPEDTSETICQNCISTAYSNLYSCLPSTEGRSIDMGCFVRYSETPFFNDNQTTSIINFLSEGSSSKVAMIAGVIGAGVVFFPVLVLLLYRLRKNSKKTEEDAPELKGAINYNYKDLQFATNNFSKDTIIGKGGFGEVFKAILDDKSVVAVKKLQALYDREKFEFENEVVLISNVHHRNLLRLLGWSSEGSNRFLVLEYIPNGSLDKFLWGAKKGTLNWKQRYDIIVGIARGLAHLHNEFHIKIVHRDVKSSNILLDDKFQAKIADFGLARFLPEDQTHVSTKFAGTLGYTSPEYALHGILSDKVDTYGFGIVTLEIISGRRCTDMNADRPFSDYLLEHAWKLYENELHLKFIDETLKPNQDEEHVMKIMEIALLCTQSPVSKRPTMSEVVLMLSNDQTLEKRQLTRPTYVDHDRRMHIGSSKNSIGGGNVPQKPKELEANEQLESEKQMTKLM